MPEDPERVVREVTFAVEGDGRTIEARIVPYNTPTQVVDHPRNGGTGIPYVERWLPGAFERQTNAANRVEVLLNFEHTKGIGNVVGHGIALREEPDALYGTFRIHPGPDGDKALHMVNEGILTGLSVEAIPKQSAQKDGIVDRIKAHLDNVALCRGGRVAYEAAQVLAVREAEETQEFSEAYVSENADPQKTDEVDAVLRAVGYEPLVRNDVSKRPWSAARSRFTDEQWQASCLVRDKLPILEPNGDVNVEALNKAATGISGLAQTERSDVARKLIRYYRLAKQDPPAALRTLASR